MLRPFPLLLPACLCIEKFRKFNFCPGVFVLK
jgi:hypothetical protein